MVCICLREQSRVISLKGDSVGCCAVSIKKKIQKSGSKNVFCVTYLVIRNVPSVVSVRDRVAELVFACRQGQRVSTRGDYLRLSKKCYYAVCFSNMWPPCSLRRRGNLISSPGPVHRGALCLEWIRRAPLLGCKHLGPRSSKGEPGCTALPLVCSSTSNIISLILPFMSLLFLQKKKREMTDGFITAKGWMLRPSPGLRARRSPLTSALTPQSYLMHIQHKHSRVYVLISQRGYDLL